MSIRHRTSISTLVSTPIRAPARASIGIHFTRRALLALGAALVLPCAHAWTDKPVRIVVPAPPGGTMDVAARIVAEALSREIHQPVIVDNKPGAGGAIGVQALRGAPPNGQTLMFTASNVLTEIPLVMKGGFDPLTDVKPVAFVARGTMVLVGAPGLQAKDLKSLVGYLKSQPGKLSFASYSAGTSSHYAGVIFNQKAGLDLQHVPFPGSPPALVQVIAGTIPIMFDGMSTSRGMIAAGKLQVYGVASKVRSPQLPDVPTLAEQGYPELDFSNWVGLVAAGNLPAELVGKIHAAVVRATAQPRVREQLVASGFDFVEDQTPEQMAQSVRAEYQRNAGIVKAFDIRLNQ